MRVFCSSLITGGIALFSLQCRLGSYVLSLQRVVFRNNPSVAPGVFPLFNT